VRVKLAAVLAVLVFAGVGFTYTQTPDPSADVPQLGSGVGPRGCYPVDGLDARDDRETGEQEGAEDEDELACVGIEKFRVIRRRLGLKEKP
jgi:hypothetical protein